MRYKIRHEMEYMLYGVVFLTALVCLALPDMLAHRIEKTGGETAGEMTIEEPAPRLAITFDDGPSVCTEELLNGLKERNVKATFFLIGENAEIYPEIVKREAAEGHLVGNHTYSHVEITRLSEVKAREEIEKTNAILEELTQQKTEYVRPPFGIWEEKLEDLEMVSVMWTIDPLDWTTKNTDEIVNRVVTKAKENDIILLHDCYPSSVQAALRIIDLLKNEGFEFVTVDELFLE